MIDQDLFRHLYRWCKQPGGPDSQESAMIRQSAAYSLEAEDMVAFFACLRPEVVFRFILVDGQRLKDRDSFEPALLEAWRIGSSLPHCESRPIWRADIERWFRSCDRQRLLEAGDELPNQVTFKLYRGVSGRTAGRRPRGFSWTSTKAAARQFALQGSWVNPAVYSVTVPRASVYCRLNRGLFDEYILFPRRVQLVERLHRTELASA